jgi:hypothetical protein
MENTNTNIKQLIIIYFALIMGQVLFASVVYFIMGEESSSDSFFGLVVPILSISTIGLSYFFYNKRKESGRNLKSLSGKINHYKVSNFIRFALMEGGNLFALVAVLLTNSMYFYLFFGLGMAAFLMAKPSQEGFINDYGISGE